MKLIKKLIQKIKGKDNIVVTDSPGTNIYKGDITGEIAKSIVEAPSKVLGHLKGLTNILLNTHPYCSFIPDFEAGKLKIIPKEGTPIIVKMSFRISEELRKYANFKQALEDANKKQVNLIIEDIETLKIMVGDTVLEQWESSEEKTSKLKAIIEPHKFPAPRPTRIYIEGHNDIGFDYVPLAVKRIEDDGIVLTNESYENRKINIEIKIRREWRSINLHFDIHKEHINRAKLQYMVGKFMQMLMSGDNLVIKDLEKDKVVFKAGGLKETSFNLNKDYHELLRKVIKIEETFNVEFSIPEFISRQDVETISILDYLINNGQLPYTIKGKGKTTLRGINKKGAQDLIERSKQKGYLDHFCISCNEEINLFDKRLDLGVVKIRFPRIKICDIESVEQNLITMPNESLVDIALELYDKTENTMIKEYDRFKQKEKKIGGKIED